MLHIIYVSIEVLFEFIRGDVGVVFDGEIAYRLAKNEASVTELRDKNR
jgi:hypothetical protein